MNNLITFDEFMASLPELEKRRVFDADEFYLFATISLLPRVRKSKKKRIQNKWLKQCHEVFDYWMKH